MAKIKNMGTATMRFGEGIIVSGSANSNEALIVTGSAIIAGNLHISGTNQEGLRIAKGDGDYRQIVFENDGVDAASFTLSNAENLVIMNETAGKDIQFWVDPASASDLQAMTIKEDGKIGIGTGTPSSKLHLVGTTTDDLLFLETTEDSNSASPIIKLKRNSSSPADADYLGQLKFQGENSADQNVTYAKITGKIGSVTDGQEQGIVEFANMKNGSTAITARLRHDSLQLLNATSLVVNGNTELEGGVKCSSIRDVNSSVAANDTDYILRCIQTSPITITLPSKGNNAGQTLIIKDAMGNAASNNIVLDGAGGDTIDGSTTFTLNQNKQSVTIVCDGINGWMITGMYIP